MSEDNDELSKERVRVRVRMGDKEIEVEGSPEYVEKHAALFLSQMSRVVSEESTTGKALEPVVRDPEETINHKGLPPEDSQGKPDLITFFREKAPQNQRDEVLTITYFYQRILGRESLTLDDYIEAYNSLRRLGVVTPKNMKSSVRNVVDRTKLLYNPERAQYALTLPGEQLVEKGNAGENDGQSE